MITIGGNRMILFLFLFGCQFETGGMELEKMEQTEFDTASSSENDTSTNSNVDDEDTDTNTDNDRNSDTDTDIPETEPDNSIENQYISDMVFQSTHNSYTGHEKGSIIEQLDQGIRFLELDVHDNDYTSLQSYRIGHGQVGSEVSLGNGNPTRYHLHDWLQVIYEWSVDHPNHSMLTIGLDIKDDLTDNHSYEQGNLAALNDLIIDQFASRLLKATDWSTELRVSDTRDKIQVILSGDRETRKLYKRDKGYNPAVAVNDLGQVIAVHDSGQGTLWYWTGQVSSSGFIEWKRHGFYGTGMLPAIALNNEGWFVEVHQSENSNNIWSHVGYLDGNYEAIFYESDETKQRRSLRSRHEKADLFERSTFRYLSIYVVEFESLLKSPRADD